MGHKTRLFLRPKIIIALMFKVMFQIILNHLFGQFARRCTKVTSCPKVPSPISLFQIGKTFKQLHRASSFDSSHDLARRKVRRRRDKNMDMILTNNSFDDFSTKASHVCLINSRTFNPTSPFNTL